MDVAAAQALVRFGLGSAANDTPPSDPRSWLETQLRQPDGARLDPWPNMVEALRALRADRETKTPPAQSLTRSLFRRDALAALTAALTTATPFRERLVWFWANHFTVSVRHGRVGGLIGPFIAEAIRPHVSGRFSDMLLAVVRHPAMLIYLDNVGSVGPDSRAGQRGRRGLNENLARECMELHTLSPAAGYTQADVTNFARILTGWSVDLRRDQPGFIFRPFAHEPGTHLLMGRRFGPGEEGGIEALLFLANHPATHRHLATRLVAHFVADDPPPGAVHQIAAVLRDTGGNLGAASHAVVQLPEAWSPGSKLRTPLDLVIASLRVLGFSEAPRQALEALFLLGQPLWAAPQPDGWGDRASDWVAPEPMMRRIDFAYTLAGRVGECDPEALGSVMLGPLMHPATREVVHRAGSRREAIALLFSSPEFQRR
jgi:uncharacterized protein (DUF1800 family)